MQLGQVNMRIPVKEKDAVALACVVKWSIEPSQVVFVLFHALGGWKCTAVSRLMSNVPSPFVNEAHAPQTRDVKRTLLNILEESLVRLEAGRRAASVVR